MATNRDVIVKLRLAGEEFDRDFKVKFQDLTDAAEKASAQSGTKAGSSFGKSFAVAAGAAGAGIALAIRNAADLGQEIASTSKQFNIGVESLQVWRKAASEAGVTASDLNSGLASLTQKIGEANAGNRQAQQGFVGLGVGFKTAAGEARATDAVMLDLAKRIASIEDPAKRVQLGTQLLGDDFKNLYPLLLNGADGFSRFADEAQRFGEVLTAKEIQELDETNRKIEELKHQLSVSVAKQVADNADAILGMADSLATLTGAIIKFGSEYPKISGLLAGAAIGGRIAGWPGAALGAVVGTGTAAWNDAQNDPNVRFRKEVSGLPKNLTPQQREAAVADITRRYGRREEVTGSYFGGTFVTKGVSFVPNPYQDWAGPGGFLSRYIDGNGDGQAPRVDAERRSARRSGGGARRPEKTDEEKQYDEALKAEERMRDAVARTLQEQRDSAEIAGVRKFLGERAAALAEVELDLARQYPGIQAQTVEGLGKALGYTEDMVKARRAELEVMLASNKAALEGKKAEAGAKFDVEDTARKQREIDAAKEKAKREADEWARAHEQAVRDVALLYEDLFTGGTKTLWRNFKDEGKRILADLSAQWTLALLSGQSFNLNAAFGSAIGRSPLQSLFFGVGGAANDNGAGGGVAAGARGLGAAAERAIGPAGARPGAIGGILSGLGNVGAVLPQAFAISQLSNIAGGGIADLLGVPYSKTGGSLFGAIGGFIGGALKGTKRASVTVGGLNGALGITGSQGNSAARRDTANAGADSLIDAIYQIADQLGGGVDASRGSVSFGMRKDSFRVDPTGRGITKVGNGAVDFGSDQEAAIRFAIGDLIKDGVITGISQASQNLLQKGGDLDKQIEKALLLEQIPKLLKQRTDPLGAALDDLYDKFKRVNDALTEGSASAEQFAQARALWELEKADAIASVGAASQSLKDFLSALSAGSSSPLSLREQRAEAERQLKPFLSQISAAESARAEVDRLRSTGASAADIATAEQAARTAAAAINQEGFTNASQLLLSISRQSNASSGAYFSDFDRIRALTGQAIGFVDQASARGPDARDPFARETAANTRDAALILSDVSAQSRDQIDILRRIEAALSSGGVGFVGEARAFVR